MEQKRRLQIVSQTWETPDAATFTLQAVDPQPFLYKPGQFISLIFTTDLGREKRRTYSLSSAPGVDALPAITVKRIPNGEFSNWLLHHAKVGDVLTTTEAAGLFLLPAKLPSTLVYIAAGSGITPVMSHLKTLLTRPGGPKILLYYANRDSRHTIFKAQLDRWMDLYPERFDCVYLFSREKTGPHVLYRHLNNELLAELLTNYFGGHIRPEDRRQTWFFICAPVPMMRMAEMTLRVLGFPKSALHKEYFRPAIDPGIRVLDLSKTHTITAEGRGQRHVFQAFEGETILNAALRQGIDLPYSCKVGVCLSCLARCVHGQVDIAFGQAPLREGPGKMINTCIGYAATEEVALRFE